MKDIEDSHTPVFELEDPHSIKKSILERQCIDQSTLCHQYQFQLASLLYRMNLPDNGVNLDQGLDRMHQHMFRHNIQIIPYLKEDISIETSLSALLDRETVTKSINHPRRKLFAKKSTEWKNPGDASERENWLETKAKRREERFPETVVTEHQGLIDLGEKYLNTRLCFDIREKRFQELSMMDLDHVSSWDAITTRLEIFIDFVNQQLGQIKTVLVNSVIAQHPDYFNKDTTGRLFPTEYLRVCLYNYTGNLISLLHSQNTSKNNKDEVLWIEQDKTFCSQFVSYLTGKFGEKGDITLRELVDMSGFMPKVIAMNTDGTKVKEPLGKALIDFAMTTYPIAPLATMAEEEAKTGALTAALFNLELPSSQQSSIFNTFSAVAEIQKSFQKKSRSLIRDGISSSSLGVIWEESPVKNRSDSDDSAHSGSDHSRGSSYHSSDDEVIENKYVAKVRIRCLRRLNLIEARLRKDAMKQAQVAIKKAEDAEKQAQDAEKQVQDAEKQAQVAIKKAEDAEKQVQDAEKQAQAAIKKAEDAEKQVQDAEKQAQVAIKKAEDAEKQVQDTKKQAQDAQHQTEKKLEKIEDGFKRDKLHTVLSLNKLNLSLDQIAAATSLTVEQVQSLISSSQESTADSPNAI